MSYTTYVTKYTDATVGALKLWYMLSIEGYHKDDMKTICNDFINGKKVDILQFHNVHEIDMNNISGQFNLKQLQHKIIPTIDEIKSKWDTIKEIFGIAFENIYCDIIVYKVCKESELTSPRFEEYLSNIYKVERSIHIAIDSIHRDFLINVLCNHMCITVDDIEKLYKEYNQQQQPKSEIDILCEFCEKNQRVPNTSEFVDSFMVGIFWSKVKSGTYVGDVDEILKDCIERSTILRNDYDNYKLQNFQNLVDDCKQELDDSSELSHELIKKLAQKFDEIHDKKLVEYRAYLLILTINLLKIGYFKLNVCFDLTEFPVRWQSITVGTLKKLAESGNKNLTLNTVLKLDTYDNKQFYTSMSTMHKSGYCIKDLVKMDLEKLLLKKTTE